jgi:hypothetical protein
VGTLVGIGLIGAASYGIYRATRQGPSTASASSNFKSFEKIKTPKDMDRTFQQLTLPEKELVVSSAIESSTNSKSLKQCYKEFLILMHDKLSFAMEQCFKKKAKKFAIDVTSLRPSLSSLVRSNQFQNLSELQQIQGIERFFDANENLKIALSSLEFDPEKSKKSEWARMYYDRCLKPHVSHTVGKSIIDKLNIHP